MDNENASNTAAREKEFMLSVFDHVDKVLSHYGFPPLNIHGKADDQGEKKEVKDDVNQKPTEGKRDEQDH